VCNASMGETCATCQVDCGFCARCGDGLCSPPNENPFNCPIDCRVFDGGVPPPPPPPPVDPEPVYTPDAGVEPNP
jgi:hypothetical protein